MKVDCTCTSLKCSSSMVDALAAGDVGAVSSFAMKASMQAASGCCANNAAVIFARVGLATCAM